MSTREKSEGPEGVLLLTRREAVARVTALLGGVTLAGSGAFLAGCAPDRREEDRGAGQGVPEFSARRVAFLDEVAETILPETDTPGAKAAAVGAFMALWVRDVYTLENQAVFLEGMEVLEEACRGAHGVGFADATASQRLALLEDFDREQHAWTAAREAVRRGEVSPLPEVTAESPPHWFRLMKETALLGYFTSEIGYHQAQRYEETPGRHDPCATYTPGDPAWAPHA